jgi:serine/threonine-protein kinase RsbW
MAEKGSNIIRAFGDYSELQEIREYVRKKAFDFGLNEKKTNYIVLAVDEACSNLIRYNMEFDKSKSLNVRIYSNNSKFFVEISDNGKSFDLLKNPPPNMNEYFSQYKKGGLGIHIIKSIVDEIDYEPSGKGKSKNTLQLIMVK